MAAAATIAAGGQRRDAEVGQAAVPRPDGRLDGSGSRAVVATVDVTLDGAPTARTVLRGGVQADEAPDVIANAKMRDEVTEPQAEPAPSVVRRVPGVRHAERAPRAIAQRVAAAALGERAVRPPHILPVDQVRLGPLGEVGGPRPPGGADRIEARAPHVSRWRRRPCGGCG